MARPERRDADYFPFYAKDGRTLHILESKYGCKGTGFFTNVMRFLTLQPNHHFCIADDSDFLYFFSRCKCDEESGLDMLNIMSKTGKICSTCWVSYRVIVSGDLLDSLKDAYKNRNNPIITIEEILVSYQDNPAHAELLTEETHIEEDNHGVSYQDNPQRKGKETKVNNIYVFYTSKIEPEQKSSQRAKGNIKHWLKHFSEEDLTSSIDNYSLLALKRNPEHRKDPANFFQKRDPVFKDYLPGVFQPPKNSQSTNEPKDPYFCKICLKTKKNMARTGVCTDCDLGENSDGEKVDGNTARIKGLIGKALNTPRNLKRKSEKETKGMLLEQSQRLKEGKSNELPDDFVP